METRHEHGISDLNDDSEVLSNLGNTRDSLPKKRNRTRTVCTFCKKRKVKCDKGQPCNACVKFGNDDCVYENAEFIKQQREQVSIENEIRILRRKIAKLELRSQRTKRSQPRNQNITLVPNALINDFTSQFGEYLGNNPIDSTEDKTNFYVNEEAKFASNQNCFRRAPLPFDWVSLMKTDSSLARILEVFIEFTSLHKEKEKEMNKTDTNKDILNMKEYFRSKDKSIQGKSDFEELSLCSLQPDKPLSSKRQQPENIESNLSKLPEPMSFSFTPEHAWHDFSKKLQNHKPTNGENLIKPKINDDHDIIGHRYGDQTLRHLKALQIEIGETLPNKKVVWGLISKFFSRYFPVAPILDEEDFIDAVTKIIGPESNNEEFSVINITRKTDFAVLGSLLLLLRLSYLSLASIYAENSEKLDIQERSNPCLKYLLANPISLNTVFLAKDCLNLFDLFTTGSLPVLQLAVFTRCYIMFAPEEGDGDRGNEINTLNGLLTNMAFSFGLNRDPDSVFGNPMPARIKNLNRRIWWTINHSNIIQAILTGARFYVTSKDYTTKFPIISSESSNTKDSRMEKTMADVVNKKMVIHELVDELLQEVLNFKDGARIQGVAHNLSLLEKNVVKQYGHMYEIIGNSLVFTSDIEKVSSTRYFLRVDVLTISIVFKFMNFYERKQKFRLMVYYIKKLIIVICYDLIPFCYKILNEGKEIFEQISDLTIIPELIKAMQKASLVLTSFYVRCIKEQYHRSSGRNHSEKMLNDLEYIKSFDLLNSISNCFQFILETLRKCLKDLSPRYFYAWRVSRIFDILLKIASDPSVYKKMRKKSEEWLRNDYLLEIDDLLRTAIQRLNNAKADTGGHIPTSGVPDKHFDETIEQQGDCNMNSYDQIWQQVFNANDFNLIDTDGIVPNSVDFVDLDEDRWNSDLNKLLSHPDLEC